MPSEFFCAQMSAVTATTERSSCFVFCAWSCVAFCRRTAELSHNHCAACDRIPGSTLVASGDGRYFSKPAIQTIIKMAAANGVRCLWVSSSCAGSSRSSTQQHPLAPAVQHCHLTRCIHPECGMRIVVAPFIGPVSGTLPETLFDAVQVGVEGLVSTLTVSAVIRISDSCQIRGVQPVLPDLM